jgi:chromate transporter
MQSAAPNVPPAAGVAHPSFAEAFRYWLRLGFINFGGPTGQIALMHADLVDRRRWISENRFLHALNYCMLLPGPEAQQLAIYIGWLLHGTRGGIAAGVLFVLPSVVLLWGLSWMYMAWGSVGFVAALFYGIKPAVVAVVAEAVLRIGRRALRRKVHVATAAAAFVGIYFLRVPFPFLILGAVAAGFIGVRLAPRWFAAAESAGKSAEADAGAVLSDGAAVAAQHRPSWGRAARVILVCAALWLLPLVALRGWRGSGDVLYREGLFFSKAAMVTFGGAYAVLAYIAQQAVEHYRWIEPAQMLDGLGLAESTPGPLIMVTQFVGFVGAWRNATDLPPLLAGTLGALLTTWVTFVPCFLWIFLGAPWIEQLRGYGRVTQAMSLVTAAVVGVVLNLAVYFAGHVIFPPAGADWFALGLAAAAFAALLKWKQGMVAVILASVLAGAAWKWFL